MNPTTRRVFALVAGIIVACAFALVVAPAIARHTAVATTGRDATLVGTPLVPPRHAHDGTLLDQHGRPAKLLSPAFADTMLFFGYTRCPDECPLALGSLANAYRSLSLAQRAKTRIVFVTVDPSHDSPAVMARYVARFGAPIIALTGTRAQLASLWRAYGVEVRPQAHDLVGHGDTIEAIDARGAIVAIYPPDVSSKDLAHDMVALAS